MVDVSQPAGDFRATEHTMFGLIIGSLDLEMRALGVPSTSYTSFPEDIMTERSKGLGENPERGTCEIKASRAARHPVVTA